MTNEQRAVQPLRGVEPHLGAALWMLDDTRSRTLRAVEGLPPGNIDSIPIGGGNTVGALLYHIAAVELDWLYVDILEQEPPGWAESLFPHQVREENGRLSPVRGLSLDDHLARLATVRQHLHDDTAAMAADDFRRPRDTSPSHATPEWILHHLREHEAEHRGQVQEIRTLLGQGR